MKNNKRSGSLFRLLARSYLLFTLTLLIIAGGIFSLWNHYLNSIYVPSDWIAMLSDPALLEGKYDSLRHYLSNSGDSFGVYDSNGKLVYASTEDFDSSYTQQELSCIPQYGSNVLIDSYDLSQHKSNVSYLLIKHTFQSDTGEESVDLMALDQNYQVLLGGLQDGKTSYTPLEYQLLTGSRYPNSFLQCTSFENSQGQTMTLLLREALWNETDYLRHYNQSRVIWLLFLPLFLADAGLFIWWLSRKIGRPLRKLNDAVISQSEGRLVRVGECGGTLEIRRIGESFDRFSDRLAESERQRRILDEGRQKLIADISHDLKTPITVIAGYIDAICDGKVPPEEQTRYLRAIQSKAEALTELVNAFHEYSKVEHPEFILHPERTDLCEFLREYLAVKYEEIDLAGFSLEISIPERAIFCQLDPLQFRRVLDNLLSNALRHNRLGTVLFLDVDVEKSFALVRVADNGSGIPPERIPYIFEPFVVGSDARSGTGSGLGLAITRRIMEKHGGTISLTPHPAPGRSTEFVLRLPIDSQLPPQEES